MQILAKNLLILASAGSGKTFQLGNRVIGLVASGASPERIVALTFTRKAAGEFADSVLTKLADAARDPAQAGKLRAELSLPDADFEESLERVVRALPSFTLGTMDSFFSKIVRGFQYELGLTGGKFDLLEGPRSAALTDDLLERILGDALDHDQGEEFFHAFRRATIGREDQAVLKPLREFVRRWQATYQEGRNLEWGPSSMMDVGPDDWARQKTGLAATVRRCMDDLEYTQSQQRDAFENAITILENHAIGSGSLGSKIPTLLANILEAVATQSGPLRVKSRKDFTIGGLCGESLRRMVELVARCELAAALLRTRAVREVVAVFDDLCAKQLRSKGLLGFNDVKLLMGEWARSEDARLRREEVDFRLDARIDHWLLDEFQDTSHADWNGLLPLIDEAASDADGSMFIVGDRKQAIYAWRGGDVGLFDKVISRYRGGLETAEMAESWRSCPEVLALVNQVCGDTGTLRELFGTAADRWIWHQHVPAAPLTQPEKQGQARVELVGKWEERLDRVGEILHELGVGQRAMTCGILLRGNQKVRQVADHLRSQGFDVIEEGRREPAKDNPVGIGIAHLMKWLADPANSFAREVVEMSPFAPVLRKLHGPSWFGIWSALTTSIARVGFAATLEGVLSHCHTDWSDFGKRRAGDLLSTLAALDDQGTVSIREAAEWLDRFELSQSPGVAAVQVMTIHKSKGLGFDVVILPEIPSDGIPQSQYFDVAEGPGWLTQTPPKWARDIVPEILDAEARWAIGQQYEAFCTLYVALTRAKRGLYILLEPPPRSRKPDTPSLENWLARSAASEGENPVYQSGASDWACNIPPLESPRKSPHPPALGNAVPRRERSSPSAAKSTGHAPSHSATGMAFGSEVHALLESIAWVDKGLPPLPETDAGKAVTRLLSQPALRDIFQLRGRNITLYREQSAVALLDEKLLSGIIDRLHVHHDAAGAVTHVEVIDYKTDAVRDATELTARYEGQMNAYRKVMETLYPAAEISCLLISVRHAEIVGI